MKSSTKLLILVVGMFFTANVQAQGLSLPTLNPTEPLVLGQKSTAINERIDTRKWRKRYNEYEIAVLIWQLYRITKDEKDWKKIFGRLTNLLGEEKDQHAQHYASMRNASVMASSYHTIVDIRSDFAAIVRYGKGIALAVDDIDTWKDESSREYILKISLKIKSRALSTLRYLPVIAGLEDQSVPELIENGTQSIVEGYMATTADRLSHMDRMHAEIGQLKDDIQALYYHVNSIRYGRQGHQQHQSAGRLLLGTN